MRNLAATVGLVLAALLAPIVIGAMWMSSKVDHTDAYVATVAPLASDPALRREFGDALGAAAAEQLARRLPVGLPTSAGDLIRSSAVAAVDQPGFPAFWRKANRQVHRQFLALMHDDRADRSGFVYVDATPLLDRIYAQLAGQGLPVGSLSGVPLDIPVARASRLEQQRSRYELLTRTATYGPWLWALVVLASVAVATGWRGRLRAVAGAALGVAVGAVVLMLLPHPLTSYAASRAGVGDTALVRLILRVVLDTLGPYARPFAAVALPVALAALLVSLVPGRRREDRA